MATPRSVLTHLNRSVLVSAALLALALSCGDEPDHYAPFPEDPAARAAVVAGSVRDAQDRRVADALVVIEPADNGVAASAKHMALHPGATSTSTPGRRATVTDAGGRFAFDGVDPGDYYLQVIADDHLGAMQAIVVPTPYALLDTIYVDVDLTPTGTFTGVATLENAANHQGTVVYVQGTSYVAVTDPTGAYALSDVPVGSYTVRAEHAGYIEDSEDGTITTAGEVVPLASMLLRIDSNIPPTATIVSASPLVDSVPVQFVASGSDVDGTVVLHEWDWEDDGIFDHADSTSGNASHVYAAGSHTAKLRVTDDDGAIGLAAVQLAITANLPPTATIAGASPQVEGVAVNFTASGNDPDGSIVLYEWDWENNGTFDYSDANSGDASHAYTQGNYIAVFRVTDDDGATAMDSIPLAIAPPLPVQVYMSWRGSDSNSGLDPALPVLSLTTAYSIAQSNSIDVILVEEGGYFQVPTFVAGIDVLGGRQWPSWSEGVLHSTFNVGTARATANSISSATLIRRLWIQASSQAGPANSIALYSSNATSALRFEECRFAASNAGNGQAGATGSQGPNGGNGGPGSPGSCDGSHGGGGSAGISPVGCNGGFGGQGGPEGAPNNGQTGGTGACVGGAGGAGGLAGDNAFSCSEAGGPGANGSNGSNGANGTSFPSGSASGTVVAGEWTPSNSPAGTSGGSGRGGGGGGGGGAQSGGLCNDGGGNGGGGGGGGAGGGSGGQGGTGGRGSIAVMLFSSSPTFISCHFETGNGGAGGAGGAGLTGGSGGSGGSGAANCTSEVGRGGNGGMGGNGGGGAGGTGGPGGPSIGVYRSASTPTITGATYSIGTPGSGGSGGLNGFGGLAPAGGTGITASLF